MSGVVLTSPATQGEWKAYGRALEAASRSREVRLGYNPYGVLFCRVCGFVPKSREEMDTEDETVCNGCVAEHCADGIRAYLPD